MKHFKAMSVAITCCMIFTNIPVVAANNYNKNSSGLEIIHREVTNTVDGIHHYRYVNDAGEEVSLKQNAPVTLSKKKAAALPSYYDLRNDNIITPIKDQGDTNACWAFGPLKSLESSSILQGITSYDDTDFSESHLAWYTYIGENDTNSPTFGDTNNPFNDYTKIYDEGGDSVMAGCTLANWWGAAEESDAPFTGATSLEVSSMVAKMAASDDSLRYKNDVQLKNMVCYDSYNNDEGRDVIKQALLDQGAMTVSLYASLKSIQPAGNTYSSYISSSRYPANHIVTIVGWDDNFNDFSDSPQQPGAWLVANSWGDSALDQGYYWVSYYDKSLCEFYSFEAQSSSTYDHNYQYDGSGYNDGLGGAESYTFANVYTNANTTYQAVKAAGLYIMENNTKYKIEVYRNLTGSSPATGTPVANHTTAGTALHNGYYTLSLDSPVAIAPGETFAIVVTISGSQNNNVYIPMEGCSELNYNWYYDKSFQSKTGQSFIYDSDENTWYDTTQFPISLLDSSKNSYFDDKDILINYNNICLKAMTTDISLEEYNKLDQTTQENNTNPASEITAITPAITNATIGVGEKLTLKYTVAPNNSKDTIVYKSSNPSIVTVSKSDAVQIKGIKTGSATITLSANSGISAKIKITVKNAPTSLKLAAPKTKLAVGKTTKLNVSLPKNSASYKLTYKSSKPKIASVNKNGEITAKKAGTTKITVTSFNGKSNSIKITVK